MSGQKIIDGLREALDPFARYMNGGMDCDHKGKPVPHDQGVGWAYLTHGDFRRAREALELADLKEGRDAALADLEEFDGKHLLITEKNPHAP